VSIKDKLQLISDLLGFLAMAACAIGGLLGFLAMAALAIVDMIEGWRKQ
jgi:hypothetical protein